MKGPKTLVAALVALALLASAVPAAARKASPYRHYVACGTSEKAKPSHSCPKKSKKGAFFRSLDATVAYSICVKFPTGKSICAKSQEAKVRKLYVNKITSNILGKHVVTWFVHGKQIGSFAFTVTG